MTKYYFIIIVRYVFLIMLLSNSVAFGTTHTYVPPALIKGYNSLMQLLEDNQDSILATQPTLVNFTPYSIDSTEILFYINVSEEGKAIDIRLLGASLSSSLYKKLLEGIRHLKFMPAKSNKDNVRSEFRITFTVKGAGSICDGLMSTPFSFKGGLASLYKMPDCYTNEAKENAIEGEVYIKFHMNADCSIQDIVVLRGIREDIDSCAVEYVRTIQVSKNALGRPIAYSIPVIFRLSKKKRQSNRPS